MTKIRAPKDSPEYIAWLRSLSLKERAELLESACRSAMAILEGRERAGLPPARPAPWPVSTLALLRKHARDARSQ